MIEKLKIQLADWRDFKEVNRLRKQVLQFNDGGLYELLNWPTYHVHLARIDQQVIGFTAVRLLLNNEAEDIATVIDEPFRRHRIASELKLTQIRDLITMGWTHLYTTVSNDNLPAVLMYRKYLGDPIDVIPQTFLGDLLYFGTSVYDAQKAMFEIRPPFPLSPKNHERLLLKAVKAAKEISNLALFGEINLKKHHIRRLYRAEALG